MPHSLPPPGFGRSPLQDGQQALLEERLTVHHKAPDQVRPWAEAIEHVQRRVR